MADANPVVNPRVLEWTGPRLPPGITPFENDRLRYGLRHLSRLKEKTGNVEENVLDKILSYSECKLTSLVA